MKKTHFLWLSVGLLILSTGSVSVAAFYDFESGLTPSEIIGGTPRGTESYPVDTFGNYFQWSGDSITLNLEGLGTNTTLNLDFYLAIIDSWDGSHELYGPDYFILEVDGIQIIHTLVSQNWDGTNLWGDTNPETGYPDSWYHYSISGLTHSASSVAIRWFADGDGWQGGDDESFAIDNIRIREQSQTAVPEPATMILFGSGIAGLIAARRRKKVR